jgi:hypothetical protein
MLPAVVLPDQLGEKESGVPGAGTAALGGCIAVRPDLVERSELCLGHGCSSLPQTGLSALLRLRLSSALDKRLWGLQAGALASLRPARA